MKDLKLEEIKEEIEKAVNVLYKVIELKTFYIEQKDINCFLTFLVYDSYVKDERQYSCLEDFDFNEGIITLKNNNIDKVKKNLQFILDYLNFKINCPRKMAHC